MEYNRQQFENQKQFFEFLSDNKKDLMAQKRMQIKHSDGLNIGLMPNITQKSAISNKNGEAVSVIAIINTTNYLDSCDDVHIDGLWNKSINENKGKILHLQEHESKFDKIIASGEDLDVFTQLYKWFDLGYNFIGNTEALVFNSLVRKSRNGYMYNQYRNGYVTNHSVGMQYMKIALGINDPEQKEEFEIFQKYLDKIVNKNIALARGFFWAVTEARVFEGSAVPQGANDLTPTLSVKPVQATQKYEPSIDTQKNKIELIKNFKFFKN